MEKQAEVSAGGYDYQFVETLPDMLICKICHFPSREPCLSECCGHTFCKSCIDHVKKATVFYPCLCPVCRSEEFTVFRNKQNERVIKSLHVYCSNKQRGCEWQGEINNITGHLKYSDGCPFEEVACSNNCDKFLQRKCLDDHLENECPRRKVACQYCRITDELQYVEGSHMDKCPKFPLSCPNDCGISAIPREEVGGHKEVCPLEEVDCPNHCTVFYIQRQYLQGHIKNECPRREMNCQHCQTVGEQQFIEGEHADLCPKYPLVCPNNCEAENILRENMQAHKKECPLEKIQCQYYGVGCNTLIARKDVQNHNQEKMKEHLSFTMSELVSTRDKLAATEQRLTVTEERLDKCEQQLAMNEHQLVLAKQQSDSNVDETMAKLQRKIEEMEYHSQHKLETKLQQKMEQVEWILYLNTRSSNVSNQNFPVIIRFSDFKSKRDDEKDWYSDPFYTSVDGYKLRLNVMPDGHDNGLGSHVSVYLYMCEGRNDDKLKWPMRKRLKVKLLNQLRDSQHRLEEHSITAKRIATKGNRWIWYAHEFISHTNLLYSPPIGAKYLVNDTLFFEVSED